MATLGRIRNQGVLLLIVIGVALLIFIVTDFVNNGSAFFREQNANVGSIDGEKVKVNDFYSTVGQMQDFYRIERGQNLDDNTSEQIRQEAWNQTVMQKLIEKDAESIGMVVSNQELTDLTIGNNPSPMIAMRPMFNNEQTGKFDPARVVSFIKELDNPQFIQNIGAEKADMWKNYWQFLETNIKYRSLYDKYNTLLSKSIVTTDKDLEYLHLENKYHVNLIYVSKPYFYVPDDKVTVEDSEVKALYEKHKEQYRQKESFANIDFVLFPIVPSEEDIEVVKKSIYSIASTFASIPENDLLDTVNYNSDVPYKDVYLSKQDVPYDLQEFAFGKDQPTVYGPEFKNNTFTLARLSAIKYAADSVKLSMIAIQDATPEATKMKADSVLMLAKTEPFSQLATKYSLDKSSASRGGDIGWVREIALEPNMAQKIFEAQLNTPFIISQGGVSTIFMVTEKTKPVKKVKLAVIERTVTPSKSTQSKIFQEAKQLAGNSQNTEGFRKLAKEKAYQVIPAQNITRNQPRLNNMANTRQIIRWIFDNKPNTISDVFECNENLIVANIKAINNDEYIPFEDVRPSLLAEVRNHKKFDILKSEMEGKSIEQLQTNGFKVDTVKNLTFASSTAMPIGYEPKLIAKAPYAEVTALSTPQEGKSNAFVFKVYSQSTVGDVKSGDEQNEIMAKIKSSNQNIFYFMIEALKKAKNVKDERYKFL